MSIRSTSSNSSIETIESIIPRPHRLVRTTNFCLRQDQIKGKSKEEIFIMIIEQIRRHEDARAETA